MVVARGGGALGRAGGGGGGGMPGDHARLDQEYMTYYHTHLAEARAAFAIKSHTQTHTLTHTRTSAFFCSCTSVMIGDMKKRETGRFYGSGGAGF